MATTKIWAIKDSLLRVLDYAGNPEKTRISDLASVLEYAADKNKTGSQKDKSLFVSGVNCSPDKAYQQMNEIKQRFGKTGGNVAYHAYQSFKTGEVSPELCHKLGVELAKRMWGDKYQVLVATHFNTGTYHNHLVVNSVGMWDGEKFNCNEAAYWRLRKISDELCREYGLSVIEKPRGHTPRSLYFAEKNGEPTKYNLMRAAIEKALLNCVNTSELKKSLEESGYILDINPNHKYATIQSKNSLKAVRLYRLGEDYDMPAIKEKLEENYQRCRRDYNFKRYKPEARPRPRRRYCRLKGSMGNVKRSGRLAGLYFHYCYILGIFPKEAHKPLSPEMREECRKLKEYDSRLRLIVKEKLQTTEDVEKFIEEHKTRMEELSSERRSCYNKLRRCSDEDKISEIKERRDSITKDMAKCRRETGLAERILSSEKELLENLKAEKQQEKEARNRSRNRGYER